MKKSVWEQNTLSTGFRQLDHDLDTDVLVIGGGMAGILCAYMLRQKGVDYALIESDRILRGVTASTTAKITAQHGLVYHRLLRQFGLHRARMYLRACEDALNQYRRLCMAIPCGFEQKDSYIYTMDRVDKLDRELKALQKIGFPAEFVASVPLPFPVAGAIRFPNQAQFHPLRFAQGIAQGLNIYEHTAARAYDGRAVVTDYGKITASKIIVATHFPAFNKHGSYFLKLYQHRSYVVGLGNGPDVDGMYMDEDSTGLSFRNYDGMLLLGGGAHRTGKTGGGWAELEDFARYHYPNSPIEFRWATQDCMSLDGVPYIGQYCRRTPEMYVATGFNKWGMTASMTAATVLSELVIGNENPYGDVFSPSRNMLRPQLGLNALESAANLLTPTKPRCPHMGCALKWNRAEHSWDCPCHGSRFGENGALLNNPATADLKEPPSAKEV